MFTAADFAALGTCVVLPDLTQGPFPTIEQIERRDITEGHAGLPLRVGVQVVDGSCVPIPGATVEIWHCDIDGDYSAYADGYTDDDGAEGTTFLRGSQVANADGIVEFHTVYPGWYAGRAVHVHAKVHIDDETVLTTQFLFDDTLNSEVMATEPYAPLRRAEHDERRGRCHRWHGCGGRPPLHGRRRRGDRWPAGPDRRRPRSDRFVPGRRRSRWRRAGRVTSDRREPAGAVTDISSWTRYRGGAGSPHESHDTMRVHRQPLDGAEGVPGVVGDRDQPDL